MNLKSKKVQKYWGKTHSKINYSQIDQSIIKEFLGSHPQSIQKWLPKEEGKFIADPFYKLGAKQKKHRKMIRLEKFFGLELSKKHFKLLK